MPVQRFAPVPAVVVLSLTAPAFAAAQAAEKHVFVSVSDKIGAEHFAVRESGKERPVVRVEPLRIPMHVALLIDTSAVSAATDQAFRNAVVDFVECRNQPWGVHAFRQFR